MYAKDASIVRNADKGWIDKVEFIGADDTFPPVTRATLSPPVPDGSNGWYISDVTIDLACEDVGVGCKELRYCASQEAECQPAVDGTPATSESILVSTEGTNYVRYYSVDKADNEETVQTQTIKIDKTSPTVNIHSPDSSAWFRNDFPVQYGATDANLDRCKVYSKDGSKDWVEVTPAGCGINQIIEITVGDNKACSVEGSNMCSVRIYARDQAGSESEFIRSFSIDLTPPEIQSLSHSPPPPPTIITDTDVRIEAKAVDSLSGLKDIKIYVKGELKQTCTAPSDSTCSYISKYPAGKYAYYAIAADSIGNEQTFPPNPSDQYSFTVVAPKIVSLKKGWNLISVPYNEFEFVLSTCDNPQRFYHYDSTNTWNIVKGAKDLEGAKGYWTFSTKDCDIKIVGNEQEKVSSGDIGLENGWNHIGSTAEEPEPNFNSIKRRCTVESILSYDTDAGNWKVIYTQSDPEGRLTQEKLETYKAYFVKAKNC